MGIGSETRVVKINPISISTQSKMRIMGEVEVAATAAQIRKRQRLDHLSPEQKMLRRKMKNRAAAQNARDRKKARMDDLEDEVILLREEKNRLLAENQQLSARLSACQCANVGLKSRLSGESITSPTPVTVTESTCEVKRETFEHAEGPGFYDFNDTSSISGHGSSIYCDDSMDDNESLDEETERQLSLFEDQELVELLLGTQRANQEGSSGTQDEANLDAPTLVGSTTEELDTFSEFSHDHGYFKHQPTAVLSAEIPQISVDNVDCEPPLAVLPPPLLVSPPVTPDFGECLLSPGCSSGYESAHSPTPSDLSVNDIDILEKVASGGDESMLWDENFPDLFPDLA